MKTGQGLLQNIAYKKNAVSAFLTDTAVNYIKFIYCKIIVSVPNYKLKQK